MVAAAVSQPEVEQEEELEEVTSEEVKETIKTTEDKVSEEEPEVDSITKTTVVTFKETTLTTSSQE